jgi:hypothetical protein
MRPELESLKATYGFTSPEYAAAVYEDMLDAAYERKARAEADIDKIGANLEREKAEIRRQREARARAVEWQIREGDKRLHIARPAELDDVQAHVIAERLVGAEVSLGGESRTVVARYDDIAGGLRLDAPVEDFVSWNVRDLDPIDCEVRNVV